MNRTHPTSRTRTTILMSLTGFTLTALGAISLFLTHERFEDGRYSLDLVCSAFLFAPLLLGGALLIVLSLLSLVIPPARRDGSTPRRSAPWLQAAPTN